MQILESNIKSILKEKYSLDVVHIKQLAGYIDFNYLITSQDGKKYILKFHTSDPLFFIEAQHDLLDHLAGKSNRYPIALKTNEGNTIFPFEHYQVRLLSFLEGDFLNDINTLPQTLISSFGESLAELHHQASGVDIPSLSHMSLEWDMINLPNLKKHLALIESPERRRIIHYYMMQYNDRVISELHNLPKQIIHGDANPMNVLVQDNAVSGFIDFGDMSYNYRIFDIAIALAYLLMQEKNPLAIAKQFISAYHCKNELQRNELNILYYLIAARLCQSQLLGAKSKKDQPNNDYVSVDELRGAELLTTWIEINPVKAKDTFYEACQFDVTQKHSIQHLLKERQQPISTAQSISYAEPIAMNQSAFQYMYDSYGETYLDCVNNIMHLGHCHPVIVEAAQKQLSTINTNTRYLYESLHKYGKKLLDTLPDKLEKIFFVNSGSAASDLGIRLAKTYTHKQDIIVVDQGYHGNTEIGIDISAYKFDNKGGNGAKDFIHKLSMPDTYRHNITIDTYITEVEQILTSSPVACFIAESILSCGGQLMLPDGFLSRIYDKVRSSGGVCIADEVQVGFGRVGNHYWGFELQDVVPDIVIMGKPIGNGHPMAAVACTKEIAESFDNGMEFFSSFGGNPVSCEIGLAVLDTIEKENLQCHAREMGEYILGQWEALKKIYDCIGDVRGIGLFLGIEFVKSKITKEPDEQTASNIVNKMKDRGILLSTDGPYHNVIKFKPPMVFNKRNADRVYAELNSILADLTKIKHS
jgi:4-aminobutyrate aminotransferase-like enzyme/Ser/Thr protein kinase RdoA (MazF antagonist)